MGTVSWFRSLIGLKKRKHDRSKHAKVHSATDKSNGTNGSYQTDPNESSSPSNGGSSGGRAFLEDRAATRIQKAYRARKSLRRIRGTGRFNVLIQEHNMQKQTSGALSCIHSWSNIQAQIRNRRLCMVTEGRIKQKKLENQLKLETKLHDLEVEWHNGSETMEEILSRIQQREEAAVKRERAMAYAFSHQWRANSSQYLGQAYYTICKENWGWSWTERWIAARPWEVRVNFKPINTKKIKTKQVSNADNKITNQAESKVSVTARPASSNGNNNKTTKSKNNQIATEIQASQEIQ
ncbi:hypothetical protein LWI28_011017 [Acer negundo]|uniref:Protein IQ-DOMAIN 1 n=1 Tax=Acer negundo TaxID=4023 RepID=A0AAD5NWG6_ACENE|nr:hypothetical protein LWI28_011017 [Acer negundo]KAK4852120.1 hypothetical protein QYF36_021264 [Acer negundo]